MIRAGRLLAVATLLALAVVQLASAQDATPPATPNHALATPAMIYGAEIFDAIPVSMLIENVGNTPDRLLGGSSPIAARFEVHHTGLVAGRRQMELLPDGLEIPPGAMLILEGGADHLMLFAPRVMLVQGRTFPLTLHFARAGDVDVTGRVRRKVDAAGITPFPPVVAGGLRISLISAPPAPVARATPVASS
jgi:periplasmic copper chaperone A